MDTEKELEILNGLVDKGGWIMIQLWEIIIKSRVWDSNSPNQKIENPCHFYLLSYSKYV